MRQTREIPIRRGVFFIDFLFCFDRTLVCHSVSYRAWWIIFTGYLICEAALPFECQIPKNGRFRSTKNCFHLSGHSLSQNSGKNPRKRASWPKNSSVWYALDRQSSLTNKMLIFLPQKVQCNHEFRTISTRKRLLVRRQSNHTGGHEQISLKLDKARVLVIRIRKNKNGKKATCTATPISPSKFLRETFFQVGSSNTLPSSELFHFLFYLCK